MLFLTTTKKKKKILEAADQEDDDDDHTRMEEERCPKCNLRLGSLGQVERKAHWPSKPSPPVVFLDPKEQSIAAYFLSVFDQVDRGSAPIDGITILFVLLEYCHFCHTEEGKDFTLPPFDFNTTGLTKEEKLRLKELVNWTCAKKSRDGYRYTTAREARSYMNYRMKQNQKHSLFWNLDDIGFGDSRSKPLRADFSRKPNQVPPTDDARYQVQRVDYSRYLTRASQAAICEFVTTILPSDEAHPAVAVDVFERAIGHEYSRNAPIVPIATIIAYGEAAPLVTAHDIEPIVSRKGLLLKRLDLARRWIMPPGWFLPATRGTGKRLEGKRLPVAEKIVDKPTYAQMVAANEEWTLNKNKVPELVKKNFTSWRDYAAFAFELWRGADSQYIYLEQDPVNFPFNDPLASKQHALQEALEVNDPMVFWALLRTRAFQLDPPSETVIKERMGGDRAVVPLGDAPDDIVARYLAVTARMMEQRRVQDAIWDEEQHRLEQLRYTWGNGGLTVGFESDPRDGYHETPAARDQRRLTEAQIHASDEAERVERWRVEYQTGADLLNEQWAEESARNETARENDFDAWRIPHAEVAAYMIANNLETSPEREWHHITDEKIAEEHALYDDAQVSGIKYAGAGAKKPPVVVVARQMGTIRGATITTPATVEVSRAAPAGMARTKQRPTANAAVASQLMSQDPPLNRAVATLKPPTVVGQDVPLGGRAVLKRVTDRTLAPPPEPVAGANAVVTNARAALKPVGKATSRAAPKTPMSPATVAPRATTAIGLKPVGLPPAANSGPRQPPIWARKPVTPPVDDPDNPPPSVSYPRVV